MSISNEPNRAIISFEEGLHPALIDDFVAALQDAEIPVASETRPRSFYAALDFLLPVVLVLLTRKFFDSFMSEAGKDAYSVLKRAVRRLVARTTGPEREIRIQIVTSSLSPAKQPREDPPAVAIVAVLGDSRRVAFVFTQDLRPQDQDHAVNSALALLDAYYSREGSDDLSRLLGERDVVLWGTVPFRYDAESQHWRPVTQTEVRRAAT